MVKKILLATVILSVFSINFSVSYAQLQVTAGTSLSGWNADSLVRNVLLGEGVTVYNVKFNNSTSVFSCNAIGKFTTGTTPTNIGISDGIILATGNVTEAVGPNNSGSHSVSSGCTSQSCPPLAALATSTVNDCSVLEFDFIPKSDSIKFQYVFASEEYPEFVCSNYNDIFGFFLSGINPANGSQYNNLNIAMIPGTDNPITINAVNNGSVGSSGSTSTAGCVLTNSQYYVTNNGSTIQYDGFTTVLTAQAKVVPCTPYHLTMAIADLGDGAYDSGVFLKANSLSSNAMVFSFDNIANPQAPSDLYEGCSATINMQRPSVSSTPTRINVEVVGDVTNGVDFQLLNSYFFFPADTDAYSITISPGRDGIAEQGAIAGVPGIEYAKFLFSPENGCPNSDSVAFNIIDTEPISVTIEHDTIMNITNSIQLRTVITGGMPNRTVSWTNLRTGATRTGEAISVTLSPYADDVWEAIVEDACVNLDADTVVVGIRREFANPLHDTVICYGEPLLLYVKSNPGREIDSVSWEILGHQPFSMGPDSVVVQPDSMLVYVSKSYIWWNNQWWEDIDTVHVIVIPTPQVSVSATRDRICEGESVTLNASGTSKFSWDDGNTFVTTTSHTFMPDTTTMYIIFGLTAGAECYGRDTIIITVDTIPDIFLNDGNGVCGGEDAELTVVTSAESFMWHSSPHDPTLEGQETHNTIIVNPQQTTIYSVDAVNGTCSNSAATTVAVEPPPVAIGEVSPRTVSLGKMEAVFTDLSKNSVSRRWEMPDGTEKTEQQIVYLVPDDADSVSLRLWAYNAYMCFDTTTVTVYVDHTTLWAPNAFTPDESTNNTFVVKMNEVQRYHIMIYDRRGTMVFESFNPEEPWTGMSQNGKKCPQGAYTYIISCHKLTYPYDQIVKTGTVMLIR